MTDIPMLKLKNGSEELEPLVLSTFRSLESMFRNDPIALYELVMKCRDRNHELFGNVAERLSSLGLMTLDGHVHDSIRNIVLSAVEGDGLEMRLTDPRA